MLDTWQAANWAYAGCLATQLEAAAWAIVSEAQGD